MARAVPWHTPHAHTLPTLPTRVPGPHEAGRSPCFQLAQQPVWGSCCHFWTTWLRPRPRPPPLPSPLLPTPSPPPPPACIACVCVVQVGLQQGPPQGRGRVRRSPVPRCAANGGGNGGVWRVVVGWGVPGGGGEPGVSMQGKGWKKEAGKEQGGRGAGRGRGSLMGGAGQGQGQGQDKGPEFGVNCWAPRARLLPPSYPCGSRIRLSGSSPPAAPPPMTGPGPPRRLIIRSYRPQALTTRCMWRASWACGSSSP